MFDARQTKEEIIDGGMKLHALYVDKCAEVERLRAELHIPCDDCAGTGFCDKVNRGTWTMEPKEKICPTCGGRGWRRPAHEE